MQIGGHVDGRPRAFALVDDADAGALAQHKWSYLRGYASARLNGRGRPVLLHRHLLGLGSGEARQGDHKNRVRLDNRRCNLRALTPAENSQNVPGRGGTSKYRGVSWSESRGKWVAQAQYRGKQRNLGRYATELEAAEVAAAFRREHMPFAEAA
jgi:hypothetical protein